MAITWHSRGVSQRQAAEKTAAAARPEAIAVEVYDHPRAGRHKRTKEWVGPWCIGPRAEVLAEIEKGGFKDFQIVVEALDARALASR